MKFKFQDPLVKFDWNTATIICLGTVYGCHSNNCRGGEQLWERTAKPKILTIWPFIEKFSQPW